jgi:hypothetical protein
MARRIAPAGLGVEAIPPPLQGSTVQNTAHWVLTNTSVKTSRTHSLPLDIDIPMIHVS